MTRASCRPGGDPGVVGVVGLLALAAVLAVVSTHTAMNLAGPPAVAAYTVAAGLVALLFPAVAPLFADAPSWVLPTLVVVCLGTLTTVFVVGVPPADDLVLGVGSDRANALDVALTELAAGRYPYSATTYLGNPITPLPGALLLAAPFRFLAGGAAWQNVAWTALLLPLLNGGWRLRPVPTLLWLLIVAGGLEVWREFLVGDDLVTGAVPALAAVVWTLRAARPRPRDDGSVRVLTAAAVALGATTCTRPHLALVVVVVAVAVGLRAGRRRGLLVAGIAGLVWAVLVVPFLLGGTARFSPLHVSAKVTGERGLSAGIAVIALAAALLLGVALWRLRPTSDAAVGWLCTAVLVAPTLLSFGRSLLETGTVWDADLTLGAVAVPFAAWAVVAGMRVSSSEPRGEDPVALAA